MVSEDLIRELKLHVATIDEVIEGFKEARVGMARGGNFHDLDGMGIIERWE